MGFEPEVPHGSFHTLKMMVFLCNCREAVIFTFCETGRNRIQTYGIMVRCLYCWFNLSLKLSYSDALGQSGKLKIL